MCLSITLRTTFLLLAVLIYASLQAQNQQDDLQLIAGQSNTDSNETRYYKRPGNDRHVLQAHHNGILAQYNPVTLLLKGTMALYQQVLSPQLSRACPYEITCSNFSKQSIHEFGLIKGVFLSADRIMRCNRLGLLDIHPLNINPATGNIIDPPSYYRW